MPEGVEEQLDQQTDKESEEKHDGFIALDKHQKDVNVQHKKFRDQERSRVAADERAEKAEKALEKLQTEQSAVVIPPVPDQYSETYAEDIAIRDKAIRDQADVDAANERAAEQRKVADEARQTEATTALNDRVATFDTNMVAHGLNPADTKVAADTVIGYGISDSFQDVLLEDPDGPLLVQYLAANPVEAEQMNGMSVLGLVNHINSDVRAKALLLKPQTSNAPDPPTNPKGGGAPEQKEDWEKGAKYE